MSAAGFIIYKKNKKNNVEFLLLKTNKNTDRCYDIPKGRKEPKEMNLKCAIRELFEECNLKIEDIIPLTDENKNIYSIIPNLSPNLKLYIAKIKDSSIDNLLLKRNPETYKFEHMEIQFKNTKFCEKNCFEFLRGTFLQAERIIDEY